MAAPDALQHNAAAPPRGLDHRPMPPARPADPPPDPKAAPLLQVTSLVCRRAERPLFAPLTFALHPGRAVWLRGANGRGKTTLLRALAGLGTVEDGVVSWRPAGGDGRPFLYLAHANALKDDLTAGEALRVLLALDGVAAARDPAAVTAALGAFGVGGKRDARVRTLSQGQKRRVALARLAVAGQPPTWLLDEPFDALDDAGTAALGARLAAHVAAGGGLLLTSHLPLPAGLAATTLELAPPARPPAAAGTAAPTTTAA